MQSPEVGLGGFVIAVVFFILLFLAFRGVMLWYWKINTIVERLDQILLELKTHKK